MRIVLDINVLVSGLLNPNGPPAAIFNLIVNPKLELLYDSRIIQEYMEVLHRAKFGFNSDWIEALIDFLKNEGEYISAEPTKQRFRDDCDRAFYEVMDTGEADYLITGNGNHFPKDDRIRNPREFVTEYDRSNKGK
jgi:putative PIN family toxin of toxin-antitoxin system